GKRGSGCGLRASLVWSAQVRRQEGLHISSLAWGTALAGGVLHRSHLCAAAGAERRNGGNWHFLHATWRSPGAVISIRIPLAGNWKHPDPFDVDLLTFAAFEAAFVCIRSAYLFGGLAKDRIAARYRQASLTDPLTGVANRRGFFHMGERLLMRANYGRQ